MGTATRAASGRAEVSSSDLPHRSQKRFSAGFCAPQDGHVWLAAARGSIRGHRSCRRELFRQSVDRQHAAGGGDLLALEQYLLFLLTGQWCFCTGSRRGRWRGLIHPGLRHGIRLRRSYGRGHLSRGRGKPELRLSHAGGVRRRKRSAECLDGRLGGAGCDGWFRCNRRSFPSPGRPGCGGSSATGAELVGRSHWLTAICAEHGFLFNPDPVDFTPYAGP